MDRPIQWPLYTGGCSIQVVFLYRWSFCTGGPSIQVVLLYRWSFCTGGPSVQVVFLYGGSLRQVLLSLSANTCVLCVVWCITARSFVFQAMVDC